MMKEIKNISLNQYLCNNQMSSYIKLIDILYNNVNKHSNYNHYVYN